MQYGTYKKKKYFNVFRLHHYYTKKYNSITNKHKIYIYIYNKENGFLLVMYFRYSSYLLKPFKTPGPLKVLYFQLL